MNNANSLLVRVSLALAGTCLLVAAAGPAVAQDKKPAAAPAAPAAAADKKDERDRKVLVDNDKVSVSEVGYKPGSSSGMIERRPRVVRALTDGTLEKTMKDGKKETVTWKAGEVRYLPQETYSQKNIGTTTLVLFTVSLK